MGRGGVGRIHIALTAALVLPLPALGLASCLSIAGLGQSPEQEDGTVKSDGASGADAAADLEAAPTRGDAPADAQAECQELTSVSVMCGPTPPAYPCIDAGLASEMLSVVVCMCNALVSTCATSECYDCCAHHEPKGCLDCLQHNFFQECSLLGDDAGCPTKGSCTMGCSVVKKAIEECN
jgi:hypothetical protein